MECRRKCFQAQLGSRFRAEQVIATFDRLVSLHGAPRYLRCDNGPEFVSLALHDWMLANGVTPAFIEPGKPWQNGVDESFNGKFRDECLNAEWFRNRTAAKIVIERWRVHYNTVRPHSSLDYLTPHEFKPQKHGNCTPCKLLDSIGPKKAGGSELENRSAKQLNSESIYLSFIERYPPIDSDS